MLLRECEQVDKLEEIGFIFVIHIDYSKKAPEPEKPASQGVEGGAGNQNDKKRPTEEPTGPTKEELEIKETEKQKNDTMKKNIDNMGDQFDCGICFQIMHQAVSLMPCLHAYCGGCFSDWLSRSKICPFCRDPIIMVKKNSQINSTIESYLKVNPQLMREKTDLELCEKLNIFKNDIVSIF